MTDQNELLRQLNDELERLASNSSFKISLENNNWYFTVGYFRRVLKNDLTMREMLKQKPIVVPMPKVPRWEYKYTPFNRSLNYIAHFNKLGAEGWELVQCDFEQEIAIFKRSEPHNERSSD